MRPAKVKWSERRRELAGLALFPGDLPLVQRCAFAMGDGCRQVHRPRRRGARSAQALAVDNNRAQAFVLVGAATVPGEPGAHRRVRRAAIQTCQKPSECGHPWCAVRSSRR